jgi:hypothetical protein
MTAIHRREMLRVLLGGAVIATAELSMFPVPAEATLYCPANRVQDYFSGCAPRRSPPQGVLVGQETSALLLALGHAARLGQAFAHCPMTARPFIPFHFTLAQNIKRDSFEQAVGSDQKMAAGLGGALGVPSSAPQTSRRGSKTRA